MKILSCKESIDFTLTDSQRIVHPQKQESVTVRFKHAAADIESQKDRNNEQDGIGEDDQGREGIQGQRWAKFGFEDIEEILLLRVRHCCFASEEQDFVLLDVGYLLQRYGGSQLSSEVLQEGATRSVADRRRIGWNSWLYLLIWDWIWDWLKIDAIITIDVHGIIMIYNPNRAQQDPTIVTPPNNHHFPPLPNTFSLLPPQQPSVVIIKCLLWFLYLWFNVWVVYNDGLI